MSRVRTVEVDVLRGAALLGICVVNVPFLAGLDVLLPPQRPADRAAAIVVELLFQGKFFVLFSFLFGWGFAIQLASAERAKRYFRSEYLRRLFGLLVFGVAHALLVFIGDILVLYSILGLALLPLRNASPRGLMRVAGGLVGLAAIALAGLGVILSEPLPLSDSVPGYLGTFSDAVRQRFVEWPYGFGFVLLFNGPMALAAFCAGLAAAKVDFFERDAPSYQAFKAKLPLLLVAGLAFNTSYMLALEGALGDGLIALLAFSGLAIGGPCLASVYLIAVVELVRRGVLGGSTAAAGRMSLTAYVAEGALAGLIFNGYGLGFYGQVGALVCLGLAIAIYALVHGLCAVWLTSLKHGPLESLLRLVTRGFAGSAVQP